MVGVGGKDAWCVCLSLKNVLKLDEMKEKKYPVL